MLTLPPTSKSPPRRRQSSSSSPPSSPPPYINNSSRTDPEKFKSISTNLDQQIVLYREARARAESSPDNERYQSEYADASETVASAMRDAADAHPDPGVQREWRRKADKFNTLSKEEGDNALRDIGKGLLAIIITPFALAGMAIYAAGTIVGGVGSILKGIGGLGVKAFEKSRKL